MTEKQSDASAPTRSGTDFIRELVMADNDAGTFGGVQVG